MWAPAVPLVRWLRQTTQKSIELCNFLAAFTHLAAVLLWKIGVTLWVCRISSQLGFFLQPQSSSIIRLGSDRPAMTLFLIEWMVILRIDVIIRSIESSSTDPWYQNRCILVSPTLILGMLGSTYAMVKLNSSTGKLFIGGNTPFSGKTCNTYVLPHHLLYLHIIRKSKSSLRAMKYIPMFL